MALPLRYNTASQEILLGPFLDETDGITAETGLTIANTDIKLWKSGATTEANKNSGGATHIAGGRYYAVLGTADVDTLGPLEVNVHVSGALPVRREFVVYPQAVYDSLFAGSDNLQVDVVAVGGDTDAATGLSNMGGDYDVLSYVSSNVTHVSGSSTAADNAEVVFDTDFATNYNATRNAWATNVQDTVGAGNLPADVNEIGTGVITADSIASAAFTTAKFQSGAISSTVLAANSIRSIQLDATAITAIQSGLATASGLSSVTLAADQSAVTALGGIDVSGSRMPSDVTAISGDSVAADNAEAAFDGTGYDIGGIDVSELNTAVDAIGSDGTGLTEAGGTGDHLSAVPWNSSWDAEVQSEVQDAIEANHLDHLLAVDYDPASKPGVSTALLNELVESDSGVSRFTANALEQAPSGSGGDATEANQTTIIGHLTDIKGATWAATDSLEAIRDRGDSAWTTATGFSTLDAAGVRTAVGLASANLDTQLSTIDTVVDGVKAVTDNLPDSGALTSLATAASISGLNDLSAAEVNAEVDSAIETYGLDHLVSASVAGADVADDSIVAKLVSKEATADWDDYVNTTDSLQALRDRGDSAWTTATGFSTLDAAGVRTAVGLASANLDTQLSAIDTVADAIEADTQDIQSRLPAALVSGRIDASVGAMAANVVTATAINSGAITSAKIAANAIGATQIASSAITSAKFASGAITSAVLATDCITSDELAASAISEIQSGLATSSALTTVDTVVDGIKAVTDNLPDSGALTSLATAASISGLNDLSAAEVNAEVDSALADYDAPTRAELTSDIGTVTSAISGLNDPSAAAIASAVLAAGDVDGYTVEETLKLCLAALAGKLSGAATTTITIRSADDSADRIVATVDADGNRTSVTLNGAG